MESSFAASDTGHHDNSPKPSGIKSKSKARPLPPSFILPLNIVFYICLIAHLLAASNAPIQDCDETFNYWEPLHYLTHGYGLQTWEYAPEFGIRSWAYIILHALPIKLASLIGKSKVWEFYLLRCLLAGICAATETRLYATLSRTLNSRIAIFYIMVVAFTPGFFYASVAFLPSSLAMYTSTLGLSAFLDWRGGRKTSTVIMWFAVGALLGWPFAGALILPFILEDWTIALTAGETSSTFRRYLGGLARSLIVLSVQVGIDSLFYRKIVIVPWKIVAYNVFGGAGKGPDIFGTEPWHFYVRNLLLNFNLWYILAMLVAPLLLIQALFVKQRTTKQTLLRTLTFITPFYLWFTIFTLQPHKEERFMFPAYPFLALNAAIAVEMLLSWFGSTDTSTLIGKIPPRLKLVLILPVMLGSINIGLLRIVGTVTSYRAPLRIYEALRNPSELSGSERAVCFGKDWYRFPTSFFLPNDIHAKFVKNEFTGLLPGEFHEDKSDSNAFLPSGTWLVPPGMNDRNEEDLGKYVDIKYCDYLIDSTFPSTVPTELEPDYTLDSRWERITCEPFLDNAASSLLARTIWIPDLAFVPQRYRRVWGQHCLLRRKTQPKSTFDYLPYEKLGINELP